MTHSKTVRISILKISYLSKAINRFKTTPKKISTQFFSEIEWKNYQLYMKRQKKKTQDNENNSE